MCNNWSVGIYSSGNDTEEYRQVVVSELKQKGFRTFSFELKGGIEEYGKASSNTTIDHLRKVDFSIFLLGKGSVGNYHGLDDDNSTITLSREGLMSAVKGGAHIFFFAINKLYDELSSYRMEREVFRKKKRIKSVDPDRVQKMNSEFDEIYACKYVKTVETLRVLDDVSCSKKANYSMVFFSNKESLLASMEKVLETHSWHIIYELAKKQEDNLLSRNTSTAFGMSLRDVFQKGYYVEPPYSVKAGETLLQKKGKDLCDSLSEIMKSDKSVLVYGEAGYGKTTILTKCFSKHLNSVNNYPDQIPLFLALRNKGKEFHFNIIDCIKSDIRSLLKKGDYPYLSVSDISLRLYCDGFDELTESLDEKDIERIKTSPIFSLPIFLTCRQHFMMKYLNVFDFSNTFAIRIQMQKWETGTIEHYIKNWCSKEKRNEGKKIIQELRENKDELQSLVDSPLLLSMYLIYLDKNENRSVTRAHLFEWWVAELAKREEFKEKELLSKRIREVWEETAWQIYLCRINGERLHREDIEEELNEKKIPFGAVIKTFDAIFEWDEDCILGTFHEQFMEYMVAHLLVLSTKSKGKQFPEYLKYVIRPEINRYFRDIWKTESRSSRKAIYETLSNIYFEFMNDDSEESVISRVHAIYHLCRLDAKKRNDVIKKAFVDEKNTSALLSLYFGAVKLGQLDREDEFYKKLQDDSWSKANRGYHLVYYDDMLQNGTLPYEDNGDSRWNGTLGAIKRHFDSSDEGHYFLRRIELFTMRELIRARNDVLPLTDADVDWFEERIKNSEFANRKKYKQYNENTSREFDVFKEDYIRVKKNTHSLNIQLIKDLEMKKMCIVFIADEWGFSHGGINVFNRLLCEAMGAYCSTNVVCVSKNILYQDVESALQRNVVLVSVSDDEFNKPDIIVEKVKAKMNNNNLRFVFIGHDVKTGNIANSCRDYCEGSKSAVIHHMSYANYYPILNNDSTISGQKEKEQESVLENADIVFANGPVLRDSARDILGNNEKVIEILPGISEDAPVSDNMPNTFKVVTFGRVEEEKGSKRNNSIIKQIYLAVAAWANFKNIYMPGDRETIMKIYGKNSEDISTIDELDELVNNYSNQLNAFTVAEYEKDRKELLKSISKHSLCMMLSLREGFGLTALEAISTGIPIIVSEKSGLYKALEERHLESYILHTNIDGINNKPYFNDTDLANVTQLIYEVFLDQGKKKNAVLELKKRMIEEKFTWKDCANTICEKMKDMVYLSTEK